MNRMDEHDALKNLDWDGVYGEVPESVSHGVQFAFMRIRAREKRRKAVMRAVSAAACVALALAAGSFAIRREGEVPDVVAAPEIKVQLLQDHDRVYAARADDYFHIRPDCSAAMAEQVQLQLVTAREFGKEKCSVCAGSVLLP